MYHSYFDAFFNPEKNIRESIISFPSSIWLSWPFILLRNIIYLCTMVVAILYFNHWVEDIEFISNLQLNSFKSVLFIILKSLLEVILFPAYCYMNFILWKIILNFYQWYLNDQQVNLTHDLYSSSMASHTFLMVPFLGGVFKEIAFFYVMFQGIRKRLLVSPMAACLILISPILWVALLFAVWVFSMMFIFSMVG